jgi:hypothetical protein
MFYTALATCTCPAWALLLNIIMNQYHGRTGDMEMMRIR